MASSFWGGFLKDFQFLKRALLILLIIAAFLYASLLAILYRDQERLIFHPKQTFPENLTLEGYNSKAFEFDWEQGQAFGYHFEKANSRNVMVFCYGNAMNVQESISRIIWFSKLFNCSMIVADYPGYGKTSGSPAQASIDQWLKGFDEALITQFNYPAVKRLIWGHSLGGGVAARLASFYGAEGLILESSFTSVSDVASDMYPFVPVSLILRHPFPVLDLLKNDFTQPVMLIHSPDDLVVNYDHSQTMQQKAGWPLLTISGGHNSGYRKYRHKMAEFLRPNFDAWLWKTVINP
jgi:pimeloyl-ACP methyl ester carboxylesterase